MNLLFREYSLDVYIGIHFALIPPGYNGAADTTVDGAWVLLITLGYTYGGAALDP